MKKSLVVSLCLVILTAVLVICIQGVQRGRLLREKEAALERLEALRVTYTQHCQEAEADLAALTADKQALVKKTQELMLEQAARKNTIEDLEMQLQTAIDQAEQSAAAQARAEAALDTQKREMEALAAQSQASEDRLAQALAILQPPASAPADPLLSEPAPSPAPDAPADWGLIP